MKYILLCVTYLDQHFAYENLSMSLHVTMIFNFLLHDVHCMKCCIEIFFFTLELRKTVLL